MNWGGGGYTDSHLHFLLFSSLLTLSQKNLLPVISQNNVFLIEEFFFSRCFYYREKNKCTLFKFIHTTDLLSIRFFWIINYLFQSNITIFHDVICPPIFWKQIKVYEFHIIFRETDGNLRRSSKLGLLRNFPYWVPIGSGTQCFFLLMTTVLKLYI